MAALGDLLKEHWPDWDINSRDGAVEGRLKEVLGTRYTSGEQVNAYKAYKLKLDAHPTLSPGNKLFFPARYRPIVRFLNHKIAYLMVIASMPCLLQENDIQDCWKIFVDGVKRNIIYHASIRNAFYNWVRDTYYTGLDDRRQIPSKMPMKFQRCPVLDSWLVHEYVLEGDHSPQRVARANKANTWKDAPDAFDIGNMYYFLFFVSILIFAATAQIWTTFMSVSFTTVPVSTPRRMPSISSGRKRWA
jgi:hypothetical protein